MKFSSFLGALALGPAFACAEGVRALYLYKDLAKADTNSIRASGFNTIIIYGLVAQSSGDILYKGSNTPGSSDIMVATNGAYTGGEAMAAKARALREGGVVKRVEMVFDATRLEGLMANTNGESYNRFKNNLRAIKDAWQVNAINYWEPYDRAYRPVLRFANVARDLGLKFTGMVAEIETISVIWEDLQEDVNKGRPANDLLFDRVYFRGFNISNLEDPRMWAWGLKMDTVPVLSTRQYPPDQAKKKFEQYLSERQTRQYFAGGGFWRDSDIEEKGPSYQAYGQVLRELFP